MEFRTLNIVFTRVKNQPLIGHLAIISLIAIGLFVGLSREFSDVPHPLDKAGHFLGFAFFTLVFGRYLGNFFIAMIIAVIAGVILESGQNFVEFRVFSYFDILMNCSGAIFVGVVSLIMSFARTPK